jgi:hypothetical protein
MNDSDKLEQIRQVILEWDGKKGHDRCWYYHDLFNKIANIAGVQLKPSPGVTREEFRQGCAFFEEQEFGQSHGLEFHPDPNARPIEDFLPEDEKEEWRQRLRDLGAN